MKTVLLVILLCLVTGISCIAGTTPSFTGQVNVIGDVKEYIYTLTNDLDTEMYVYCFSVYMPQKGANAVTEAWCSREEEGWLVYRIGMPDNTAWFCGVRGSYLLQGESVTMKLTTSADVPTVYNYTPPDWSSNWNWANLGGGLGFGNSIVPVPAPEPSSILAFAGGLIGIAGFAIRRKK